MMQTLSRHTGPEAGTRASQHLSQEEVPTQPGTAGSLQPCQTPLPALQAPLTEDVTRQHRMRVTLKLPSLICSLGRRTWKLSSLLPALTTTWQPFSGKSVTQGSNLR